MTLPNLTYNRIISVLFLYFISAIIVSIAKNEIILSFVHEEELAIVRTTSHLASIIGLMFVLLITFIFLFMVFLILYYFFGEKLDITHLMCAFEVFVIILIIQEGLRLFIVLHFLPDELQRSDYINNILNLELKNFTLYNSYINWIFPIIGIFISAYRFYEESKSLNQVLVFCFSFSLVFILFNLFL